MTIKTSPAIIEFAKFVFENPGSTRGEILDHLWTKITFNRRIGEYDQITRKYTITSSPVTKKHFKKNACGHLFSPYFSNRMSDTDGSFVNILGKTMDWYRVKNKNNRYCYFLTPHGLRLLNAIPLTDRTDPNNTDPYISTSFHHYRT